jgi:hypothetical protein
MTSYEYRIPGPTTRTNQSRPLLPIARLSGAEYITVTEPLLKDHDERWSLNDTNYEALVQALIKVAKKQTPGEAIEYIDIQNQPTGPVLERGLPIEMDGKYYFLEWSRPNGYMVLYTHQVHTEMPKAYDRKHMTSALAEAVRKLLQDPKWETEPGKPLSAYSAELINQRLKDEKIARDHLINTTRNLASRNCTSALKKWVATLNLLAPLRITGNTRQRVWNLVHSLDTAQSELMTRVNNAYTPTLDGALIQLKARLLHDLENNLEIDPDDVREFCVLTDNGRLIGDPSLPAELLSWGHTVIPVPNTERNQGTWELDRMARKQERLAKASEKFLQGEYRYLL